MKIYDADFSNMNESANRKWVILVQLYNLQINKDEKTVSRQQVFNQQGLGNLRGIEINRIGSEFYQRIDFQLQIL